MAESNNVSREKLLTMRDKIIDEMLEAGRHTPTEYRQLLIDNLRAVNTALESTTVDMDKGTSDDKDFVFYDNVES